MLTQKHFMKLIGCLVNLCKNKQINKNTLSTEVLHRKAGRSSKVNRLKANQNGTESGIKQRMSTKMGGRKVELSLASFPKDTSTHT